MSMESAALPPGIARGTFPRRVLAYAIDAGIGAVFVVGLFLARGLEGTLSLILQILAGVLLLAWLVLLWWMFAFRGAGLGMRVTKLELVGLDNGRPVGGWRYLWRFLVLVGVIASVVGLVVMIIFIVCLHRVLGFGVVGIGHNATL